MYQARSLRLAGLVTICLYLGLGLLACSQSSVAPAIDGGGPHPADAGAANGGASGDTAGPPAGNDSGDSGFELPPGGDASDLAPAADGPCAEEIHKAEQKPLDVLLLVDRSQSMNVPVIPGSRKWDLVREALLKFLGEPATARIGVGLQFFPNAPTRLTCAADSECATASGPAFCRGAKVCDGKGVPVYLTTYCDAAACPADSTCRPRGVCQRSTRLCFNLGGICAGGAADDLCQALPRVCGVALSCEAKDYEQAVQPIVMPGAPAAAAITDRLLYTETGGGTPMRPAIAGALTYLRAHLAAHPERSAALILATDGIPEECGAPGPSIGKLLADARAESPPIPSYLVGVFSPSDAAAAQPSLRSIATMAGAPEPLFVNAGPDLSQKLLEGLDRIRSVALPCAFAIPQPSTAALDFGKVNLHFRSGTVEEEVGYVARPERCDPTRGGWYYDVDPKLKTPQHVVVCGSTCDRWKADSAAEVDLRFGCATRTID